MESLGKTKKHKLIELVSIRAGYPFRGALKEVKGGGVHAIQARDISEIGELLIDSAIETQLTGKRDADWLTREDVLFISKGQRATACYVEKDFENVTCAPSIFILKARPEWKEKLNMQFIAWQLNQSPIQNLLKRNAEGTNQVSIRKQSLAEIKVGLPSIENQDIIAKMYTNSIQEHNVLTGLIRNTKRQMSAIAQNILRAD